MSILSELTNDLTPANLGLPGHPSIADMDRVAATVSTDLEGRLPGAATGAGVAALRAVLPASSAPAAPPGAPYSAIYVFGDSLSDVGNDYTLSAGLIPSAPYDDGRFSNGPLWVEDLAGKLGLQPPTPSLLGGTDFAYGGAETGGTAVHTANPIDLPGQLAQFEAQVPDPSPNALYTVWIGSNDVMDAVSAGMSNPGQAQLAVSQAAANEGQFLESLIGDGAKHLLVLDVPDLGVIPYEENAGAAQASLASALSRQFDTDLSQEIATLDQSGQASIDLVDTYAPLDAIVANPAANGFTNVRDPVWTGGFTPGSGGTLEATGAAQNGYLFFDTMHPTAAGHAIVANVAAQSLGVA